MILQVTVNSKQKIVFILFVSELNKQKMNTIPANPSSTKKLYWVRGWVETFSMPLRRLKGHCDQHLLVNTRC